MDQERKNLQYTKHVKSEGVVEEDINFYPDAETLKTRELCATIIHFNIKRKGFSDLTGALPHKSIRGNLYVIVMYDYDSNAILVEPIKNRQAATIRDAFLNIHKFIKARGNDPKVYIIDNECSSDLKEAMKSMRYTYNWIHRTCTDKMQRNEQSELSKNTSYLDYQQQIHIYQSANGNGYYLNE